MFQLLEAVEGSVLPPELLSSSPLIRTSRTSLKEAEKTPLRQKESRQVSIVSSDSQSRQRTLKTFFTRPRQINQQKIEGDISAEEGGLCSDEVSDRRL